MLRVKNTRDYGLLSNATISEEVRSTISLFVCKIESVLPEMMRINASKSYLQVNLSPKRHMANKELVRIAVAALADKRTMSANGSTPNVNNS